MGEVRPRVTGTEMEWPIGWLCEKGQPYDFNVSEHRTNLVRLIQQKRGPDRGFLFNGARCYNDSSYAEYSTGEEDTMIGTVAAEYAGERIMVDAAEEYMAERDDVYGYQILKRSLVDDRFASGYHINLCGDATTFKADENDLYNLGLCTATLSMMTGAGGIYTNKNGVAQFVIAQKSTKVKCGFSEFSHDRPLIRLDSESHAKSSLFNRIEIIALDPNIAPWSTWMQLVVSSLCLRSIEQRIKGRDLRLHYQQDGERVFEPLAWLARNVATNQNLDTTAKLLDGLTISAIDIQWELLDRASRTEHTPEEAKGLQEWEKALTDIAANDDFPFLSQKNGWIPRREALWREMRRHGLDIQDDRMRGIDRKWDSLGGRCLATILRERLWYPDMPDESMIRDRMENPCPNTRASLRSKALRRCDEHTTAMITWERYSLGNEGDVDLWDPLMTDIPDKKQRILEL